MVPHLAIANKHCRFSFVEQRDFYYVYYYFYVDGTRRSFGNVVTSTRSGKR